MSVKQSTVIEAKLVRAKAFAQAWREVDPNLCLDKLTLKNYDEAVTDMEKAYLLLVTQETAIDSTRGVIGALVESTDADEVQLRAFARVKFGANSMQYGQLGGTRTSERKKSKGRPKKSDKPATT